MDKIHEPFENSKYTLGVLIDLSKAFDTANHNILIKQLEMNGTVGMNLKWFENYLINRKQYIQVTQEDKTSLEIVKCGVPQGSILGPLLFLLYVNDLQFASDLLDPISADDTNLFHSSKNASALLITVNKEL